MAGCGNGGSPGYRTMRILLDSGDAMKYLLIVPAVLLGAALALYVWLSRTVKPLTDWENAYN